MDDGKKKPRVLQDPSTYDPSKRDRTNSGKMAAGKAYGDDIKVELRTSKRRTARKCSGKTRSGEPCPRYAMIGQLVCQSHGGRAPRAKAAAARRIAEEKARRWLVRREGVEPLGNALEALHELAGEQVAFKDHCGELVRKLLDDGEEGIRYRSSMGLEQVRGEVQVYQAASAQATVTLTAIARLNIDERLVRVEEAKAAMIAEALSKSLTKAGITAEAAAQVRREFAKGLKVIPGEVA